MITKTFQYKGQMINYYYKLIKNPKIGSAVMGYFSETGYTIKYSYKK